MNRWLLLSFLAIAAVGCSIIQPASKPTSTPAPTAPVAVVTATVVPSATSLPPTPTEVATQVSAVTDTPAATNTSAPTDTPAATPTNTRAPVTPKPQPTATNTTVALKYPAPQLIEPHTGQSFRAGKDDLVFKWQPVADLGANECYLINIQIVNALDQRYSPFSEVIAPTCNSAVNGGPLKFVLNRPTYAPPNYGGMLADAQKLVQSNLFTVRWWVTVVRNDGTPLSPASAIFEFALND